MTAPLLPLQSTSANRSTCRVAVAIKCIGVLFVLWGIASWVRLSGPLMASPSPLDDNGTTTLVIDGEVEYLSSTGRPGALESAVPVKASSTVRKHTDRVAVIIEDRPLGNLVPILLHFHSVLGPEWPIILYTSPPTSETLLTSASLARAVASASIEIRHLPPETTFSSHASVSQFLTSRFIWTDLAPYLKILLFQTDSILCSASPRHIDEFLPYDFIGAPILARFGTGFNGGLSLRNRELILRVLDRWDFAVDSAAEDAPTEWKFEDQWFYARMRELGEDPELRGELGVSVDLPDQQVAASMAVETIWVDGARPLGFHQPQRWQSQHIDDIMEYCPEVGMIAGSSFFGR
ncbi:hypothetical protein F5B22DRAFT_166721 [Xylaria bambusicola]|uniref:uncharacterized protein n=1 Tax=Xylaria bambusicola TaxID=326684 RepID=UPI00200763E4|nr:uncharacterized protein F5B22DRAFT_166721 [Xylaria bambusicola]KAI0526584.1 hypothetical protein F5B22DRAFT_166721 [Xylaria bambusicola]